MYMPPEVTASTGSTDSRGGFPASGREPGDGARGARVRSPILEQEDNNRKQVCQEETREEFIRAVAVRCNSWMCEHCKKKKGYDFRSRLLAKAGMFREPRLYTVTVNREWHESPEAAYEHVSQEGYIRRLMKLMGVKRWLWVLEAQEASGDGWPHWHILIDVSELPAQWYNRELKVATTERPEHTAGWVRIPHFFDLNRVHRLLRKWAIGEQCRLSKRKGDFESAEHAINYITKYLVKMPERGFPVWMLKRARVRFVGASGEVGRLVTPEDGTSEEPKEEEEEREKRAEARPPVERLAECGEKLVLMQYLARQGTWMEVERVNAPKKAVEACGWAVKVDDFDFATQKSFPAWGFSSLSAARQFAEVWELPKMQKIWEHRYEKRKRDLLSSWAGGENDKVCCAVPARP
jgi:hypothetical protein